MPEIVELKDGRKVLRPTNEELFYGGGFLL